jgi:hypothetical protein
MESIYKLLFEGDEVAKDYKIVKRTEEPLSVNSADTNIDHAIQDLAKSAQRSARFDASNEMMESLSRHSLDYLLREQGEDPFAEEGDDTGGDEAADEDPFAEEGDDTGGGDEEATDTKDEEEDVTTNADIKTSQPAKLDPVPINMSTFVDQLRDLLNTPELGKKINLETIIINRAKNYILEQYDDDHLSSFEDLMYNAGFDLERHPREEGDNIDVPLAVGAYAGGTGGLGGGG